LPRRTGSLDGAAITVVSIAFVLGLMYLIAGAYYGYIVGRAMSIAKASNPTIAMVATAIGRDNAEQFAIGKLHVPRFIQNDPTFWIFLRMNE
jgi:hypothetical protein